MSRILRIPCIVSRLLPGLALVIFLVIGQPGVGAEPKRINLLNSLQPKTAGVAGNWQLRDGELQVDATAGARIALPWTPTAAYDFEIEFTRHSGRDSVALMFVAGGNQATFDIDGWGQHLAGIQNIAGRTMRENSTRVPNITLENNRRYKAAVRVRPDWVEAVLDDKVIATYRGTGSDLSLVPLWALPDRNTLGLGAWNSRTTFHSVTVAPIAATPEMVAKTQSTTPTTAKTPTSPPAENDDLVELSDEFTDPATLRNWLRIYQTEQTQADQLAVCEIGRPQRGWLTLVPHASSWYQDYRGMLVYKNISGDFVVTTRMRNTNRAGNGAPRSNYSLAGIMVRTPRDVTPRTWRPGGENYIFLSHGSARNAGRFEFEVKTTINSNSQLEVTPATSSEVLVRVVRVGPDFVLLRKDGDRSWQVHQRYRRPDMPKELQVGLTVYTDYSTISRLQPLQQNTQVIRGGNPDLRAMFDYVHFERPQVPASWRQRSIANSSQVSDADILAAFGN